MHHEKSRHLSPSLLRLRQAGYKLTEARVVVLNAIEQLGGHVTSAQVLERVSALAPNIGRASVFRTLDLLTRLGIVRPTYIDSSATPRYVLMRDGHHHHIICTSCNKTIEFEDCGLDAIAKTLEERLHVKLTGHLLEFFGVCATCQASIPLHKEERNNP